MSLLRNLSHGLRSLFSKERVEREFDEELTDFLRMAAEEKTKQGMSPKDALRAVRLERGSLEIAKEVVRSGGGWESFVETCWRDFRYGLRVLRKSPTFTLIALLTLTLGLGINCAIFTVVNAVLLRPLPYPNSERLVLVQRHFPEITFPTTTVTKFLFWREHSRDFESMTAYGFAFSGVGVNLTGAGEPEHLHSLRVSADFFRTLGEIAELSAAPSGLAANCGPWSASRVRNSLSLRRLTFGYRSERNLTPTIKPTFVTFSGGFTREPATRKSIKMSAR